MTTDTSTTPAPSRRMDRLVAALLRSPLRRAVPGRLSLLRYTSSGGRHVCLPVQVAPSGDALVVVAGNPEAKRWWRAFRRPRPAQVLLDGQWFAAEGRLLQPGTPSWQRAGAAYVLAHPSARLEQAQVVLLTLDGPAPVPRLGAAWRRWFAWTTAGEVAGFTAPAVLGAVSASWSALPGLLVMVAAGVVEGAVLGWAQSRALVRVLPRLRARRFVAGTAAGAAIAYAVGMAPSRLAGTVDPPVAVLVVGGTVGALVLLASIGIGQWWELRHCLPHSGSWVLTTAGAWAVGLAAFMAVAMPLWHEGQSVAQVAVVGLLGALVMAATVAALTGLALIRLLARPESIA